MERHIKNGEHMLFLQSFDMNLIQIGLGCILLSIPLTGFPCINIPMILFALQEHLEISRVCINYDINIVSQIDHGTKLFKLRR